MVKFLLPVLKPLVDVVREYFVRRGEVKAAEHLVTLKGLQSEKAWEVEQAKASANSWKDEYLVILLTLPVVCVAYSVVTGDTAVIDRMQGGFAALAALPDWYQIAFGVAVGASFGIRGLDKVQRKK